MMQVFRHIEQDGASLVGAGLRVLLLTADGTSPLTERLAGLGGFVEVQTETYGALGAIMDDPGEFGLFVMECDGLGGLAAGRRAMAMLSLLKQPMPGILVAGDCEEQIFPEEWRDPVVLRSPPSAVSLRVGLEHALRSRLIWLRD